MHWLGQPGISVGRKPIVVIARALFGVAATPAIAATSPSHMVDRNHRAEWVFAFKFNAGT
jgi:hypothetical protein